MRGINASLSWTAVALAEPRQTEIAAVVEELAAFRPTHVAVEWSRKEQASLDDRYRDYRAGRYELSRREQEQLGLRLATIGDDEQQPGANWVGYWYGRNLRIFNNVVRLTDRPEDRILVIYGQGHA